MSGGGNGSFIAQVMAPGGGILLIPFTRAVIACLFVVTATVFLMGVARIHMFILSFLSAGMWLSLGVFQKAYTAAFKGKEPAPAHADKKKAKTTATSSSVSQAKRED